MKKLLLILFLLASLSLTEVNAVRNYPLPVIVTQSDGTSLYVKGCGDEDYAWYETTDGVLLRMVGSSFYIAEVTDDGELTSTTLLAHERASRTPREEQAISLQNTELFFRTLQEKKKQGAIRREPINESSLFPHTGSPKCLVILTQFQDSVFSVENPHATFDRYLNADDIREDTILYRNYGSVKKYFSDMSGDEFTPQFDVVGPVTLPKELSTSYGVGDKDSIALLIQDACKAVDDSVDFSAYDQDGDKCVDLVYIIYAGYAASWTGVPETSIWPKSGTVNGGRYDGVTVYRYGVGNELNGTPTIYNGEKRPAGPGIMVHEMSHTMGLPDMYATSASAQDCNNQAMEYWDLMDAGEYTENTYCPKAYTAWEREAFGWMTIDTLTDAANIELKAVEGGGGAYRIINPKNEKEYFILENVQQTGWDSHSYGHGLIVSHVLYNAQTFSVSKNTVNNTIGTPGMTVLAADSLLLTLNKVDETTYTAKDYINQLAGDPFPGTSEVTALTSETAVKPIWYSTDTDGERIVLDAPITYITEETDGTVTLKYKGGAQLDRVERVDAGTSTPHVYDLQGRSLNEYGGSSLEKGIYIINGKKIIR